MRQNTKQERWNNDFWELLRLTYILLMPGAHDIAGFGTLKAGRVHALYKKAEEDGYVKRVREGQTFEVQNRFTLTNKGVNGVRSHFGLPLKKQFCQGSWGENFSRIRLYEPLIRLAPRLFRCGAIELPFVYPRDPGDDPREVRLDEATELVDIDWLESTQDSAVHAIAWYRTSSGDMVWVPIVTVGLHHTSRRQEQRKRPAHPFSPLSDFVGSADGLPSFNFRLTPPSPIGAVFIALGQLAGLYVNRRYPDLPKAVVEAEGQLISAMIPDVPMGSLARPTGYTGQVGLPEVEISTLERDPKVVAMRGVPQRKIYEWVNSFPCCDTRLISLGVRHPQSKIKDGVAAFAAADLMDVLEGCMYLSYYGRIEASHRDRTTSNVQHGRLGAYTAPDPSHRLKDRVHEQAVALTASQLQKEGIIVFPGWRLEITYPGKGNTQLRPDLWILVPLDGGRAMWLAVEVERSATAVSSITHKLGHFRIAKDLGEAWPVLVIAGKGRKGAAEREKDNTAVHRFMDLGNDLPMLVTPFCQVLEGKLVGADSRWLRGGRVVPITDLQDSVKRPELFVRLDKRVW